MVVLITPQGGVAVLELAAGVTARGLILGVDFWLQQGMAIVNQLPLR